MTKDEEKAEGLNTLSSSAFNSKASCSLGTQPPKLEDRDGEQNKALTIQRERVSDLLHHLRHTKVYRAGWDLRGLR